MSRAWAKGSTRRWRKLRAGILAGNRVRTGGRCQLGLPGVCTGTANEVHHPFGKAAGDHHLVPCCGECNRHVGDPATHDPACAVCRAAKIGIAPTPRVMTKW